ncbi:MAG: HEAT repeat domain-containing protein [Thermoguttaceae bacterium]
MTLPRALVVASSAVIAVAVGWTAIRFPAEAASPVAKPAAKPAKEPAEAAKPVSLAKASWIWSKLTDDHCQLRTTLTLPDAPSAATISITADNDYELFINGTPVSSDIGFVAKHWSSVESYNVKSQFARGLNVIGVRGAGMGGVRGVIAAVRIEIPNQPVIELATDPKWRAATKGDPKEYSHPEFVEGFDWRAATVVSAWGPPPWGKVGVDKPTPKPVVKSGKQPAPAGPSKRPAAAAIVTTAPDADFRWPEGIAFLGDDCSVYVPKRGDAWGLCFRVHNWSRAYTEFDIPVPSKIGRKLFTLKPVAPGASPKLLLDAGRGAIGSPCASYDGRFIYFAAALGGDSFFHVYRIAADGGTPQRLTDGPFHDIDPAELPDGRIVFTSTRIGTFEEYHNPPSRALFVMKPDGTAIEPITFTPIFDNEPKPMADGRVAFVRTDNFFDRGKVETQIHAVRPDGADGHTEMGADTGADYGGRLRSAGYGSPAPMSDGRLACISSRGNLVGSAGASERNFLKLPGSMGDLASLPDNRLMATLLRGAGRETVSDVIVVVQPRENKFVPIFESTDGSVHSPVFLGPRPRPPVLAELVDRRQVGSATATGFLTCQNVRMTRKTKADWQNIRGIRVLAALALTTRSSHSHIVHAGHETVELGTVPIAPDGSFSIEVPADIPLALQAVDAEGRSELNEMSWIYVRPGERRSCVGCHHTRTTTPGHVSRIPAAVSANPLKLLGQGQAHRFRGNNSGVTGMMDLQFERFRENASLNRYPGAKGPASTGRQEVAAQIELLSGTSEAHRVSAAQRLGIFRDRAAAPHLAKQLSDDNREARASAAWALAACGTRESVAPLLDALHDGDPVTAQAAAVALANITGHAEPFDPFVPAAERKAQAAVWKAWFQNNPWDAIEKSLVEELAGADRARKRRVVVALGHVAGPAGRKALREYLAVEKDKNPYPGFAGRTDQFTFDAVSPLNPRTIQEAARALGHLNDAEAVSLLANILDNHVEPKGGNLFLAEAAIEAIGRIDTPQAETILIGTFGKLKDYWQYVGWYSDHPALYACHSSPLHARIIQALDAKGSTKTGEIVPALIRSMPTDPDRALFPENDDYETLVGRVIARSGRGDEAIETCLAALGDADAMAPNCSRRFAVTRSTSRGSAPPTSDIAPSRRTRLSGRWAILIRSPSDTGCCSSSAARWAIWPTGPRLRHCWCRSRRN